MSRYVVVARLPSKPTSASNPPPATTELPGTWHLAEVLGDDELGGAHACGSRTAEIEMRRPVRVWGILEPWCRTCETLAGDAARAQAAREARWS